VSDSGSVKNRRIANSNAFEVVHVVAHTSEGFFIYYYFLLFGGGWLLFNMCLFDINSELMNEECLYLINNPFIIPQRRFEVC